MQWAAGILVDLESRLLKVEGSSVLRASSLELR
jgi:hypothetical protein